MSFNRRFSHTEIGMANIITGTDLDAVVIMITGIDIDTGLGTGAGVNNGNIGIMGEDYRKMGAGEGNIKI